MFGAKKNEPHAGDFGYLDPKVLYFDSACQTLRPQKVLDAQTSYFREYNSCGGRVKYAWGGRLDEVIADTREKILNFLGVDAKEYTASFTLNTTFGINLLLGQLPAGRFSKMITSEIEHNSVFLPTIAAAKRLGIPRKVLPRDVDGSLAYAVADLEKAVVLVSAMSNIDGMALRNAGRLAEDVHARDGILLLDAAQAFAHRDLQGVDFDALFASAHKAYGPSLGIIVVRKSLLEDLDYSFLGGGTVSDVHEAQFDLISLEEEPFSRLEPGLQNFSGIVGLDAALDWFVPKREKYFKTEKEFGKKLFEGLQGLGVTLTNPAPSPIISFFSPKIDAHRLALYLSENQIYARSGYFCCHYYLKNLKRLPPLLRISLGAHNTAADADVLLAALGKILKNA